MPAVLFTLHKADVRQCGLDLQRNGLPTIRPQNELDFSPGRPHSSTSLTGLGQTSPIEVGSLPGRAAGMLQLLSKERGTGKSSCPNPVFLGPSKMRMGRRPGAEPGCTLPGQYQKCRTERLPAKDEAALHPFTLFNQHITSCDHEIQWHRA